MWSKTHIQYSSKTLILLIDWKNSRGDYFTMLCHIRLLRSTFAFSFQGKYSVKFGYYMQWCNFSGVKEKGFRPISCRLSHRLAEAKQSSANANILTISLSHCVFRGWHKNYRHADLHAKSVIFKQLGIIAWIFGCFKGGGVATRSILCIFPQKLGPQHCKYWRMC